jgi:thymidine kinase
MEKTATSMFISGSMFGAKSKVLMDLIEESHIDKNIKYLVFKPTKDTRDGLYVKSRVYDRLVKAFAWDQSYEDMQAIFDYLVAGFALTNPDEIKNLFFDEIHFLSKFDLQFIVDTCKKYDVNFYGAGLETTFKLTNFESTEWFKEVCDSYLFNHGNCNGCGKEHSAIYNILFNKGERVIDGADIQPGDAAYKVYCQNCISNI